VIWALFDDEGYIYLQARKKEIIKVGGKRVSLKEIEEVIVSLQCGRLHH
jgi:acyl-coenzyme A synthetase/AMP-(fatty) acid ligase